MTIFKLLPSSVTFELIGCLLFIIVIIIIIMIVIRSSHLIDQLITWICIY